MSKEVSAGDKIAWLVDSEDPEMPRKGETGIVINDSPRSTEFMVKWRDGGLTIECDLDRKHLWDYAAAWEDM